MPSRLLNVCFRWRLLPVAVVLAVALGAANDARAQVTARIEDQPGRTRRFDVECPKPEKIRDSFKRLTAVRLDIRPQRGPLPPDCFAQLRPDPPTPQPLAPRTDQLYQFAWAAPGMFHHPLYFEDVPLERYGHAYGPVVQPVVSGARFFGTALTLPYRLGVDRPHTPVYPLGYVRPGTPAPRLREQLPFSPWGAALQGGATSGLLFLFPL